MKFLTNTKVKKLWIWTVAIILLLCGLLIAIKSWHSFDFDQQRMINKHLNDNLLLVNQEIREIASLQEKRQTLLSYWMVASEVVQFNQHQVKNLSNLVHHLPKAWKLEKFSRQKYIYTLEIYYSTAFELELGVLELRKIESISRVSLTSLLQPAGNGLLKAIIEVEFDPLMQGET